MARPKIRGVQNDLSQVATLDWARLAAFIDGEGHIALNANSKKGGKQYAYLRVILTNTDPRLIVWAQRVFGGGVLKAPRKAPLRRCFKWTVSCRHAEAVLRGCLPYFILKRDQAEIALAFQETLRGYHRWNPQPADVAKQREDFRAQLLEARQPSDCDIVRDVHGNAVAVTVN
jgi:hypothetical protein